MKIKKENEFKEALSNDFNTANAITSIQKIIKLMNTCSRSREFDSQYACELLTLLDKEMWVLGIDSKIEALDDESLELVRAWNKARMEKDFALAVKDKPFSAFYFNWRKDNTLTPYAWIWGMDNNKIKEWIK